MTTTSTNPDTLPAVLRARLDAFFATVGQGFNAYVETRARTGELRALNAKSDAELAHMGLTRDRIVHHVFRDQFVI